MKKIKFALSIIIIIFAVNSVTGDNITFTNDAYIVKINDFGNITTLDYPKNGNDHVSSISGMLYHNGGGVSFWPGVFTILSSNILSGNSVVSVIKNDDFQIALQTDFLEKYMAIKYIVTCITNVPLNNVVYYHYQDCDLYWSADDDIIGRDPATRIMYQSHSNIFLGTCIFKPDMQMPDRYMGNEYPIVREAALNNTADNTITQATDSAVILGFPIGTLNPEKSFTILARIGFGSNLTQMLEAAFPANFAPEISKFNFGINFKKQEKDKMSFRADFDPTTIGLTNLDGYLASLYVGDYEVLNSTTGIVKNGKNGGKATYQLGDSKVLLKLNTKKSTAQLKVKVKKTDLADSFGITNNGAPGQLDLPIRFWLSSTGFAGANTIAVPYSNKQDKNAKGKQPKEK